MTKHQPDLGTPWSLHFDRDGTEDYGIICDAEGNDIVASHLPERQEGYGNVFWLPEKETDPVPQAVRQMRVMTAAPKLLESAEAAWRRAANHEKLTLEECNELYAAIAEATGQEYDQKAAEAARHLHRAAPRMLAALKACDPMLRDYGELIRVVDKLVKPQGELPKQIEDARFEACAAWHDAQGEILF